MEFNFNTNTGTGKKKGSGVLAGLVLLVVATVLLWWNEYNNVQNIAALSAFEKEAVEISSDAVNSQYDGKAVTTNGKMTIVDDPMTDSDFSVVSIKTASLKRVVEIRQWEEKEDTDDNGHTTYRYNEVWSEGILGVPHDNRRDEENRRWRMPCQSKNYYASDVKVGAYNLSPSQIEGLATNADLEIPTDLELEGYHKSGTYFTNSADLERPAVGDVRICWKYNNWSEASVAATVSGNSFVDYTTPNSANSINRVDEGLLTKAELVKNQEDENNMLKWILRGVGALMVFIGYSAIFGAISRLVQKIPILGTLVGGIMFIISLLFAIVHALLVIIIAWFRYRPVLAITLLAIVIIAIILIVILVKKNKNKQQTA